VCRLEAPLYALGWWVEKVELFDDALRIRGPRSHLRARAHAFRARPGPMHLIDVSHAERAEAIACDLGEDVLVAFARFIRCLASWWSGDTATAIELATGAAEVFAAAGKTFEWTDARKFLGVALVLQGEAELGLQIQRDALDVVRREIGSPFGVAHNLAYLGHCHRFLGDDVAAAADWTEARALCGRIGNRGTEIHVHIGLAEIAADRGDTDDALASVATAVQLVHESRAWTYEPWAWTTAMRAHAEAGEVAAALACGRRAAEHLVWAPSGEATRLASELAGVALRAGDDAAAARLLGVAAATPDVRELPFPSPAERRRRDEVAAEVEARLGASVAASHLAAGRRCSVAEAAGSLLERDSR
jgi:tetratricopeptide (TPR) repeat protein